ncbi:hypothetical protein GGI12_002267 [Dipsacomyces acuminosporus]|nr:hypothetical protein GGI12_002267 [Dipsacomyces acuminosporus]
MAKLEQQLKPRDSFNDIFNPAKVPGSSVYTASNGMDLGVQAIFAGSFFVVFIVLFSVVRLRWPFIFSPRTRLTITAPPFLSRRFFGWCLSTMRTPEAHILNTLGLDSVIFLRFYKMCMRLLLDVAFFSIVIIWPLNIKWSKSNQSTDNLNAAPTVDADDDDDAGIIQHPSVTDYLFNLTLDTSDPKQKMYLVPHIFFAYIFSALAYYHISKFSSRWASLRWHFLMRSRHALVSRTVMLTGVPRHLANSPRELEWFWGPGLQLGKIERVRVCPFNTKLTSSARERAKYLTKLEHAYKKLLGNPCEHPGYDPERLRKLALDSSEAARKEENELLTQWCKPSRRRKIKQRGKRAAQTDSEATTATGTATATGTGTATVAADDEQKLKLESEVVSEKGDLQKTTGISVPVSVSVDVRLESGDDSHFARGIGHAENTNSEAIEWTADRPTMWIRSGWSWRRVDEISYWRTKFLAADSDFSKLRKSLAKGEDDHGTSTTAFVTFEDAASAHMVTQLSCYPNPGYMKAKLAPEPRGVYWPNIWISNRRKWAGFAIKWLCILVIWVFWSAPVVLFSSLVSPNSLKNIFPDLMDPDNKIARSFLSSTVPSLFLLLFLNMLPWVLKQVHFATGVRTKPDIDYSVLTKMWAFLVFNVVLIFGSSGTFWDQVLNVVNKPGTVMQKLATNIPKVGTFFTGYILVLGVGYQPFKLLQVRPVIWHIGRQWLCSTPRDYARLVSPVYIDWYSVYPYPLLVFTIAMIYSTFSPPVVVGAVIYFVIGYPVMKYLLLYVYFHPFETAGMVWPRVCRRMIFGIILYQLVILTFVVVKGGGWYTFSMVPLIFLYLWFFYFVGWSLEKQGTVLPVYLWRNPPPNSSYPLPPDSEMDEEFDARSFMAQHQNQNQNQQQRANAAGLKPIKIGSYPSIGPLDIGAGRDPSNHMRKNSEYAGGPMDPFADYNEQMGSTRSKNSTHAVSGSVARQLKTPTFTSILNAGHKGKVVKRTSSDGKGTIDGNGHRRESSRSARTREIILAGRVSSDQQLSGSAVVSGLGDSHKHKREGSGGSKKSGSASNKAGKLRPRSKKSISSTSLSKIRSKSSDSQSKRGLRSRRSSPVEGFAPHTRPKVKSPLRKARRKNYKSLAEAATMEGSRLIASLGKLPTELHSLYSNYESKRSSQTTTSSAGAKRWSISGMGLFGSTLSKNSGNESTQLKKDDLEDSKSNNNTSSSDSDSDPGSSSSSGADVKDAPSADSGFGVPNAYYDNVPKLQPVPKAKSRYEQARVHSHSPLSRKVFGPQLHLHLQSSNRPSMLRREVNLVSPADKQNSGDSEGNAKGSHGNNDDGDEGEWSDISSDADERDTRATTKPLAEQPGTQSKNNDGWDPLVYLKTAPPVANPAKLHGRRDPASLGSLLTSIPQTSAVDDGRQHVRSASYNQQKFANDVINESQSHLLRRRHVVRERSHSHFSDGYQSSGEDSAPASVHGGGHAGAGHPLAHNSSVPDIDEPPAPPQNAFVSRAKGTLQRVRDYFLADFKPAGPILDLTFDRLYAQGDDEENHEANGMPTSTGGEFVEDNGDSMPPLREILDRVLPRAVSRTFSQSPMRQTPRSASAHALNPLFRRPSTPGNAAGFGFGTGTGTGTGTGIGSSIGGAHAQGSLVASPFADGKMQSPACLGRYPVSNSPRIFPSSTMPASALPLGTSVDLGRTHARTASATSAVIQRLSMSPASGNAPSNSGSSELVARDDALVDQDSRPAMGARKSPGHSRGLSLAQVLGGFNESARMDLPTTPQTPVAPGDPYNRDRSNSIHAARSLFARRPTQQSLGDRSTQHTIRPGVPLFSPPSNASQYEAMSKQPMDDSGPLPPLPIPPRAPWLSSSEFRPPHSAPLSNDSARSIHSVNWNPRRPSRAPSSVESVLLTSRGRLDATSSHKNSLPPPRAPLPTRIVSELNYTTRRTATAGVSYSVAPNLLPPREDPSGDLLIANYQRFAVEAQSTFEPDEHTDYSQTPMLNFRGILDRGIQDYVHPGLVGELPTLWLPVKRLDTDSNSAQTRTEAPQLPPNVDSNPTGAVQMMTQSAPRQFIKRILGRYQNTVPPPLDLDVPYSEQAYYAQNPNESQSQLNPGYANELQEVLVHPAAQASGSMLPDSAHEGAGANLAAQLLYVPSMCSQPLEPIPEGLTPRASAVVSPELSPVAEPALPIGGEGSSTSNNKRANPNNAAAADSAFTVPGIGQAQRSSTVSKDGSCEPLLDGGSSSK